jgi:hypothetical protein
MTHPWGPLAPERMRQAHLGALRLAVTERVGQFAASRMDYEVLRELDPPALAHRMTTELLACSAGPQVYTDRRSASVQLVRFASWWDHFKATHRRRWWMRWRHWQIHYTMREATAVAEIKVEATIAAVFPHAEDLPPGLGPPYPVIWGKRIT